MIQSYEEKSRENCKVLILWTFLIYHQKIQVKYKLKNTGEYRVILITIKNSIKLEKCYFIPCIQRSKWLLIFYCVSLFIQINSFCFENPENFASVELEAFQPKQINTLQNKSDYGDIGSICQKKFFFAIRYKKVQLLT